MGWGQTATTSGWSKLLSGLASKTFVLRDSTSRTLVGWAVVEAVGAHPVVISVASIPVQVHKSFPKARSDRTSGSKFVHVSDVGRSNDAT